MEQCPLSPSKHQLQWMGDFNSGLQSSQHLLPTTHQRRVMQGAHCSYDRYLICAKIQLVLQSIKQQMVQSTKRN